MPRKNSSTERAQPLNYRHWLARELGERKLRNPAFSLRSFSRKLGVSPACLSLVLAGKRRLTPRTAALIADRMNLAPDEREALLAAASRRKNVPDRDEEQAFQTLENDAFRVISDWHHYAILSLAEVPGSQASPRWIADRLGIPLRDAEDGYRRLERLGIIREHRGRYRQVAPPLATRDDLAEPSIRSHVLQHLRLAEDALQRAPSETMDFSSLTMAISPSRVPIAKQEIKKFRRRLCRLLEGGRREAVYTLSVQLYPLERGKGVTP